MRSNEVHLADLVAGPFGANTPLDFGREFFVGCPITKQGPQIEFVDGEKTITQLALGSQAHPVAVSTERLGDARDHADLAFAVEETESLRRFVTPLDGFKREDLANSGDDFFLTDNPVVAPALVGVERHPLDKPNNNTFVSTETSEVNKFVVVDTPHHHTVDLDRLETGFDCCVDAIEHRVEFVSPSQLEETILLQANRVRC